VVNVCLAQISGDAVDLMNGVLDSINAERAGMVSVDVGAAMEAAPSMGPRRATAPTPQLLSDFSEAESDRYVDISQEVAGCVEGMASATLSTGSAASLEDGGVSDEHGDRFSPAVLRTSPSHAAGGGGGAPICTDPSFFAFDTAADITTSDAPASAAASAACACNEEEGDETLGCRAMRHRAFQGLAAVESTEFDEE